MKNFLWKKFANSYFPRKSKNMLTEGELIKYISEKNLISKFMCYM